MTATQFALCGLLLFTAAAAAVDYRTGHIPNRLVLWGGTLGVLQQFALHLWVVPSADQGPASVLGAAALNVGTGVLGCALVPLLLYRASAMGGGDVKLLAAVGAWAGPIIGLQVELYAFVVAAIYAPARLAYEGQLLRLLGNSAALVVNPFLPKARRREVPPALLTELRVGPSVFVATLGVALVRWW